MGPCRRSHFPLVAAKSGVYLLPVSKETRAVSSHAVALPGRRELLAIRSVELGVFPRGSLSENRWHLFCCIAHQDRSPRRTPCHSYSSCWCWASTSRGILVTRSGPRLVRTNTASCRSTTVVLPLLPRPIFPSARDLSALTPLHALHTFPGCTDLGSGDSKPQRPLASPVNPSASPEQKELRLLRLIG